MNTLNATEITDVRDKILATGQRIMASKGYSAVGLKEILTAASVPKGSFYHYFSSKDAFGEALLEYYFEGYLNEIDRVMAEPGLTMAQRILNYFEGWQEHQAVADCQGRCLAVKLGAEVADLSEAMRLALKRNTAAVMQRLAEAIEAGVAERSLTIDGQPADIAQSLYQLWLGGSVMAKIVRSTQPFDATMATTRQILHLPH